MNDTQALIRFLRRWRSATALGMTTPSFSQWLNREVALEYVQAGKGDLFYTAATIIGFYHEENQNFWAVLELPRQPICQAPQGVTDAAKRPYVVVVKEYGDNQVWLQWNHLKLKNVHPTKRLTAALIEFELKQNG